MELHNTQYQVHPEAFATEVDDQLVILHYETGTYFTLNEVGARIWQLLDQGKTLQAILDTLRQEYDASEQRLEQDLINLVKNLKEKGIIL